MHPKKAKSRRMTLRAWKSIGGYVNRDDKVPQYCYDLPGRFGIILEELPCTSAALWLQDVIATSYRDGYREGRKAKASEIRLALQE